MPTTHADKHSHITFDCPEICCLSMSTGIGSRTPPDTNSMDDRVPCVKWCTESAFRVRGLKIVQVFNEKNPGISGPVQLHPMLFIVNCVCVEIYIEIYIYFFQ